MRTPRAPRITWSCRAVFHYMHACNTCLHVGLSYSYFVAGETTRTAVNDAQTYFTQWLRVCRQQAYLNDHAILTLALIRPARVIVRRADICLLTELGGVLSAALCVSRGVQSEKFLGEIHHTCSGAYISKGVIILL